MSGIVDDDEFEAIRQRLSQLSEADREQIVAELVSEGKLEETLTGTRYVFTGEKRRS